MPLRLIVLLALCLGAFGLAGCGTSRQAKDKNGAVVAGGSTALSEDYSSEAVENRVEAHARYANAILLDLDEKGDLAAEEFFKAALADPTNEELVLDVSRRLLHQKKTDQALELLKAATALPMATGNLYARLGLIYSLAGKKAEAIQANQMAIKKLPRSLQGYQHLAQIYLQSRQPDEGLKVLDQAAKVPGVDAAFLIELSEFYLAFGRTTKTNIDEMKPRALELLDRAAKQESKNALLQQKLADNYTLLGQPDRAATIYKELLQRWPHLPGLREKLTELYLRQQDRKEAVKLLEDIVRENPTNPQAYYFLGGIAFDEKDPKKAAEYFSKTVLLSPEFEQAYYDLAGAQINLNEPKLALETLRRAKEKFQQSFVGEFFAAMAYNRMENYSNAISHFIAAEVIARATETNRLNHTFYFQLGTVYEHNKQFDEAEKYFRKALTLSPSFSEALNYLGYMWAELGTNLSEALELIEKAVKLEPKNAAYLDSLGWVLYKLDKPKEGLEYILKAIEHSPEPDPTLYDHLGDIYGRLNEVTKAREAWRKAIEVKPNDAIQKKLEAPVSVPERR